MGEPKRSPRRPQGRPAARSDATFRSRERGYRTPEGVHDLAGNAGEWCLDGVGDEAWVHPGSWDQPSMASWAKARALESRDSGSASRGFRLVKA